MRAFSILFALSRLLFIFLFTEQVILFGLYLQHFSHVFSSLDVYSVYYDAILKSKINTVINVCGLILSLVLRWWIASFEMPPFF
jgi:hypothetical protein